MDLAAFKVEIATLTCETSCVEFKSATDGTDARFWVQIVRSVVAMNNSEGGAIVFGLDSTGQPSGTRVDSIRMIDPVEISDKVKHYTGQPLSDVRVMEFEKHGATWPGFVVQRGTQLIPFSRPGDVHNGQGKPDKLFQAGQLYVRRGASCVAADARDFALIVERIRNEARREFAEQIGQFAVLPAGHMVQVVPTNGHLTQSGPSQAIRVTDDPSATTAVVIDKFVTHPHRQRDLIARLATKIPGCRANTHDIVCIRKVHASEIEEKRFIYRPPHASPHYSNEFADWIAGRIESDPAFLEKTRSAARQLN